MAPSFWDPPLWDLMLSFLYSSSASLATTAAVSSLSYVSLECCYAAAGDLDSPLAACLLTPGGSSDAQVV